MENMVRYMDFWKNKRVLVTGHSGFKGSWLVSLLKKLGAAVSGYSVSVPTEPSMFQLLNLQEEVVTCWGDIRDQEAFSSFMKLQQPEILFHLAAQPLVRKSYSDPLETFSTNVMGTLSVLNAALQVPSLRSIVVVTTDKCYRNEEWVWGYRETDALGGNDPYSASKACAELVIDSWRSSFIPLKDYASHKVAVATARAGNVIGGGDWGEDRIIPDSVRAFSSGQVLTLRNPLAVRPWQHVLEPLNGYLRLAERLWHEPLTFSEAWNFGPLEKEDWPVQKLVDYFARLWGNAKVLKAENTGEMPETKYLRLDSSKAARLLPWRTTLSVEETVEWTVAWYKAWSSAGNLAQVMEEQLSTYLTKVNEYKVGENNE